MTARSDGVATITASLPDATAADSIADEALCAETRFSIEDQTTAPCITSLEISSERDPSLPITAI